MTKEEFKKSGGSWLGAAREWMQWNCINGDSVTWASDEVLRPQIRVKMLEDVAGEAAYAEHVRMNSLPGRIKLLETIKEYIVRDKKELSLDAINTIIMSMKG